MNMKKITLSIASLFFALFLLVGCNNAPKPAEERDETTVNVNVEITADTVAVTVDSTVVEEAAEEIVE